MGRLKACRHYKGIFGDETQINESKSYPWNAWVKILKDGHVIYSTFVIGVRWNYIAHLASHKECCDEIGVSMEEVKKILQEIEDAWAKADYRDATREANQVRRPRWSSVK